MKNVTKNIFKAVLYFLKGLWVCYQIVLGVILVFFICLMFRAAGYVNWLEIRGLKNHNPAVTSFMKIEEERIRNDSLALKMVKADRKKRKMEDLIWQQWVPMDSIPESIRDLAIIAEDGKFFQHSGFDLEQIEYALVANKQKNRTVRGASTISQQVVKNLYLTGKKDYMRKIKEGLMTVLLEYYLEKDRILEVYLNIAQFGPGIFGVQTASLYYYGKPVYELTFNESVALVALLPKPLKWFPQSRSLGYIRHCLRIGKNMALYKKIRAKVPDDIYKGFLEYAVEEERIRWQKLRDRELNGISFKDSTRDSSTVKKQSMDSALVSP